MERTIALLFILLFTVSFSGLAQKVRVKKGKILIDGQEVAIIEATNKSDLQYSIKDLAGKNLMEVDVDIAEGSTRPFEYNWMTVSSKDYPQINVVDYSMISMSLSHPKIIAEIFAKTYGMISSEGVNHDKIAEFFAEVRTSKYKKESTGSGGPEEKGLNEGFDGKVKLKKDQILFDGEPVVSVVANDGVYSYTDLKSGEKLDVTYYTLVIPDLFSKKWLEVTDGQNRKTELPMDYMSAWGGLNLKKDLARLLSEKYNVITLNGIENLDSFYEVVRENLSEGYKAEYNEIQGDILERAKYVESRIADFKVDEMGNITTAKDGTSVGRIALGGKPIQNTGGTRNVMALGDAEDKVIAKFEGVDASNYKVSMFDKKEFEFNSKVFSADSNKKEFFEEVVQFAIVAGYDNVLEYSIRGYLEKEKELAIEEYKRKKAKSPNFYGKKGYVIDANGKRWEGDLTLQFEKIIDPSETTSGGNILEIGGGDTKYGKEVKIKYINEKGKTKYETFKAKNDEEVVIFNEDGSETKYRGLKTNPDAFSIIENSSGLSFNYSGYYEVLEEDGSTMIFKNPLNGALGIKVSSKEKGYFFENAIQTKNTDKLREYLSSCSDIPDNLVNSEFSKVSSIKELLKYYKNSCK